MNRRRFVTAAATVGVGASAGCVASGSSETLADPTVHEDSSTRKALVFAAGGEEVGSLGVDGDVSAGSVYLGTELSHSEGTEVESIELRVWMPDAETDAGTKVAVVSPVEGDSSPPPEVTLSTPERARGETIEVTDLDDLADETISTLELIVRPGSAEASTVAVDVSIELASSGAIGTDYTLEGELRLEFPGLEDE